MQPERDTAGSRCEARPGDVDEHGAAAAINARPCVVIELKEHVVEPVVAPQPVPWFIGRAHEAAIVAPVSGVFAPGIGTADAARRQQCAWPRQKVGAPPQAYRVKTAARGAAVAFALVRLHAAPPKRHRHHQGAGAQPPLRAPAWPSADTDRAQRNPSHAGNQAGGSEFPNPRLLLYPQMFYFAPDGAAKSRPRALQAAPPLGPPAAGGPD